MADDALRVGEYAVCPGHGVGRISAVERRDCGGAGKDFYVVEIVSNGMTVMVPTDSRGGIRRLVSEREAREVYGILRDHDVEVDTSTWNRRHREYMGKIKTGSLKEIAEVLRELFLLKERKKTLSFGEKRMFEQCRNLIADEIALLGGGEAHRVKRDIDACFG